MHPDKKLGLALGILLIGVTGALFFRNENPQSELHLQDPQSLDDQIAQQQGPKPHIDLERPEPIDENNSPIIGQMWSPQSTSQQTASRQSGSRQFGSAQTDSPTTIDLQRPDVQEPILAPVRTMPADKIAKSTAPPDPIPTESPRHKNDPIPLPRGNRGWEAVTTTPPAAKTQTTGTSPSASPMQQHVVRRGETLSGLASRYLGSSARFGEIYRVNRDQLRRPSDLRVGMRIRIPPRSAKQSDSTQTRSMKPVVAKQPVGRASSSRRVSAHPVSRETSRTTKSQSGHHRKRRSWFVPVRRPPFLRRPRGHSPKKPSGVSRKKLSQVPPTDLPTPPKK